MLYLTGQQIGILDYKVIRYCQQLSDERTTARQHKDGIIEHSERCINGIFIRRQRSAHDNVNCLRAYPKTPARFKAM